MKLLVGLGNPGAEYARNRHNVGFMALDGIASRHGFGPWKRKFQALAADGEIAGVRCLLLKPQTYMNESGRSVGEAARFLKIAEPDVVVLHDEVDLASGRIKVKAGGGNAGHNGLRSITAHLGNDTIRVRIGVGHPGAKELVAGWVLHDFAKSDDAWLAPLLEAIADACPRLVKGDDGRFLSEIARALRRGEEPDAAEKPKRGAGDDTVRTAKEETGKAASPRRESALAERLRGWLTRKSPPGEGS